LGVQNGGESYVQKTDFVVKTCHPCILLNGFCDWYIAPPSVIGRRRLRRCGKIELVSIFLRNVAVHRKALAVRCVADFFYVTSFVNGKILALRCVTGCWKLGLRPLLCLTPNMGDLVQREHPQN